MISSYDIYKFYFGEFKPNVITNNKFRKDNNPSFIIGINSTGEFHHFDFAISYWQGDCFKLVQQIFNCNYDEALKKIDQDFGLGINSKSLVDYKKIVSEYKQPEELGKRYCLIQAITRKFTKEELQYWNEYHISLEDLRENNVYSIKELYVNRSKFFLKDTELRFGYLYNGHWKTYRPFANKKNKWFPNNVPITALDGQDGIKCNTLLIQKSKKDFMIMNKIYPYNIAVQNEGMGCFTPENVEYMKSVSDRQILSFDSDTPGVTNSQQITKQFDFDYCNVPRQYLSEGIKDWSDLGKKYGLKVIESILKDKNIL